MSFDEDCFVLIVGGGPVGLTLALELGRRNVPTVLVCDQAAPSTGPRCNYIGARSMEHFRRLGVSDQLGGFPLYSRISFRTQYRRPDFGRIDLAQVEEEWIGPEKTRRLSQAFLEPALRKQVAELASVRSFYGWKATEFAVDDEAAVVGLVNCVSGARRTIRARYLVGCDGSNSAVRDVVGAKMVGKDGTRPRRFMARTKINYLIESDSIAALDHAGQLALVWILNRDCVGFVHKHDGGNQFLVQYQVPLDRQPNEIDARAILARMLGDGIDFNIINEEYWDGGVASVADRYRQGRAFLAGDAAHLLTPLGGFAMGTGIGDAVNLGWKLAAELHGWAGPGLLDSYVAERQETGIRNSLLGVHSADRKELWEIPENIEDDSADGAAARQSFGRFVEAADRQEFILSGAEFGARYISATIVDPAEFLDPTSFHHYTPSDESGARLPHFFLADGSSLYDALGTDFSLIVFGDIDTATFESCAAARSIPLKLLRIAAKPTPFDHNLVLVRPDTYIAWSAHRMPRNPGKVIDIVRGAVG